MKRVRGKNLVYPNPISLNKEDDQLIGRELIVGGQSYDPNG